MAFRKRNYGKDSITSLPIAKEVKPKTDILGNTIISSCTLKDISNESLPNMDLDTILKVGKIGGNVETSYNLSNIEGKVNVALSEYIQNHDNKTNDLEQVDN